MLDLPCGSEAGPGTSLPNFITLCLWGVMNKAVMSADTENWSDSSLGSAINIKFSVVLGHLESQFALVHNRCD